WLPLLASLLSRLLTRRLQSSLLNFLSTSLSPCLLCVAVASLVKRPLPVLAPASLGCVVRTLALARTRRTLVLLTKFVLLAAARPPPPRTRTRTVISSLTTRTLSLSRTKRISSSPSPSAKSTSWLLRDFPFLASCRIYSVQSRPEYDVETKHTRCSCSYPCTYAGR
ncbi:hypothetical protein OE88DRAFT_1809536, partial [Heliocybe sulcata]